jgi:hypothetical protein
MTELSEKVVGYLPQYLTELGLLLIGPKRFISDRNANTDENFRNSLLFLALSLSAAVLMQWISVPSSEDNWKSLTSVAVSGMLFVILCVTVIWCAFFIVGGRAPFRPFLISYCYPAGFGVVFFAVSQLFSLGIFKQFDPANYQIMLDAVRQRSKPPDLSDNNVYLVAQVVRYAGAIFVMVWSLWVWDVYREISGVSARRSGIAFFLTGVLFFPAMAIANFIVAALE